MTAPRAPGWMAREIAEIPAVVARQLAEGAPLYREAGQRLARLDPPVLVTCARGTSDNAATYLKYLVETRIGVPVASVGPSVGSVYGAALRLSGAAVVTISQSGGSPDLAALQAQARAGGALALALVNAPASPVGDGAGMVLPLLAGPERAVAATKSYVASLVAAALIVAEWAGDAELAEAVARLPEALETALACDWPALGPAAVAAGSMLVIGRGPGLSVALEAALKLKETCRLHAEAFSAAEVLHGPIALAGGDLCALAFGAEDAAGESVRAAVVALAGHGVPTFLAGAPALPAAGPGVRPLPQAAAPHPLLVAPVQAASFYRFAEALARSTGHDPDAPPHLSKITRTV